MILVEFEYVQLKIALMAGYIARGEDAPTAEELAMKVLTSMDIFEDSREYSH